MCKERQQSGCGHAIMDGGLPANAPPRPGTPAYEAWQAERAKEAARPKGQDAAR